MTAKDITPVTEAAANRQGCYVVDITVTRDNDITVVLDKETGTVGMEDCIAVNDAVLAAFDRDVEDYALTVTSAGLDLPFKDIRQYRKAIGSQVEVLVRDGRKLIATLLACDESGVTLEREGSRGRTEEKGACRARRDLPLRGSERGSPPHRF